MDRVEYIRSREKEYHDFCYENYQLFQEGTWLSKPVKTVLDFLGDFNDRQYLSILDLGCGNGRNSIPIAENLKYRNGRVVCVDLLDSALVKLQEYSKEHKVFQYIEPRKSDIEKFVINPNEYDFIVAVSALEHLSSKSALEAKLIEMLNGTRANGVNCLVFNTSVKERNIITNEMLDPMFEVNLSTESMLELLKEIYCQWKIEQISVKDLQFNIERDGQPVRLITSSLTFVAKRLK